MRMRPRPTKSPTAKWLLSKVRPLPAPSEHEPVPLIQPEGFVDGRASLLAVPGSGCGLRDDGLRIALPP